MLDKSCGTVNWRVIQTAEIQAVVVMVPFEEGFLDNTWVGKVYLVEKPGLNVSFLGVDPSEFDADPGDGGIE